jgi:hypothetical protein
MSLGCMFTVMSHRTKQQQQGCPILCLQVHSDSYRTNTSQNGESTILPDDDAAEHPIDAKVTNYQQQRTKRFGS